MKRYRITMHFRSGVDCTTYIHATEDTINELAYDVVRSYFEAGAGIGTAEPYDYEEWVRRNNFPVWNEYSYAYDNYLEQFMDYTIEEVAE